jgi:hypothetical protein
LCCSSETRCMTILDNNPTNTLVLNWPRSKSGWMLEIFMNIFQTLGEAMKNHKFNLIIGSHITDFRLNPKNIFSIFCPASKFYFSPFLEFSVYFFNVFTFRVRQPSWIYDTILVLIKHTNLFLKSKLKKS